MLYLSTARNPKSVGIVGDGDDVELLEEIEETFGITIADEDAESIVTLGEAYVLISSKMPANPMQQGKCLTAMAYYRLNRTICGRGKMRPASRLEVPEGQSPKSFQKQIEDKSNLRLPRVTRASYWVLVLAFLQFVTWIVGPVVFTGIYAVLVGAIIAAMSHTLWRVADHLDKRVWMFDGTLGDLAKETSKINIGKLVSLGGHWTDSDVWAAMTSLIHDFTGYPPENMTPEMKFI